MKKIKFESDNGYSIEFATNPDDTYILRKLVGNDMSGEANSIKIPSRDGNITYNLTRSKRNIEIECSIISKGSKTKLMKQVQAENRDYVARCFDPGHFGTLYYYASRIDGGKKIRCRPTGLPAFESDINNLTDFKLGFESDDSMWSSAQTLTASIGMTYNNYRFPCFMGAPSAFSLVSVKAVINNTTLYNISPIITVYNSAIPVNVINLKTGAFLKFKSTVEANQRLIADVKNATAILEENTDNKWEYKTNVIHYLTPDSRLTDFVVAPGENEFKIDAAAGENPILVIAANTPVMGI